LGELYCGPVAGARALSMTQGTLALSGGGLQEPLNCPVTLAQNNRLTASDGTKMTFTITPSTGLIKGSLFNRDTGRMVPFQGMIFRRANVGVGFFLGADQSGEVYLNPAP